MTACSDFDAFIQQPASYIRIDTQQDDGPFTLPVPVVLYGDRWSRVRPLLDLAADQLSHVALVINGADGPATVELDPGGPFSRSVEEFSRSYHTIGVAVPAMSPTCTDRVLGAANDVLHGGRARYSWALCSLIGCSALARRVGGPTAAAKIEQRTVAVSAALGRWTEARGATCASVIADCLMAACADCRVSASWPARPAVPLLRRRRSTADVRPLPPASSPATDDDRRRLLTPSDLWVGRNYRYRLVLSGPEATVLLDDQGPQSEPSKRCELEPSETRGGDTMATFPFPFPRKAA